MIDDGQSATLASCGTTDSTMLLVTTPHAAMESQCRLLEPLIGKTALHCCCHATRSGSSHKLWPHWPIATALLVTWSKGWRTSSPQCCCIALARLS